MKTTLERYGFPKNVVEAVKPIIQAVDVSDVREAEQKLARLCLEVCDGIETGKMTAQVGDAYFTLIELYIGDNHPHLELEDEARTILIDGMTLHDHGTAYAPKLADLRASVRKILGIASDETRQ